MNFKKICTAFGLALLMTSCATASQSTTSPLGNLLGGLKGSSSTDKTTTSSSASASGLGSLLGGVLSGLISTDDVNPQSMVGTWNYSSPAVSFKSDNFLQQAGGAAAAGVIEGKLAPYYEKLQLNKMVLTINEDLSFTMQSGLLRASGTIEKAESGDIIFRFQALKSINIGSMTAYVTMTGSNSMSLMFDVSKLMTIVKAVSSVSGSTTIKTMTSLLDSYDGICAGFKLTK